MEPGQDLVCFVDATPVQPKQTALPAAGAFQSADTIVTAAAGVEQVITPLASARHKTVPINDTSRPLTVDTPIFTGKASLLLRNLPGGTPHGLFEGKRRQMMLAVQGCFKQPDIALDSLVLGSDFARPLKLPAAPLISHAITWLAHKLGGGVSVNVSGQQPFILAPLIAAAQVVNVAPRGQEPDLLAPVEDLRLFDAGLVNTWTSQPLSAKQRRSHFSCAASKKGRCFDTQHVWTFLIYEHVLDYSTFLLNLPFFRLDMVQLLNGQPLQLMLKDLVSGRSMLHLTVWHRRMLQHPANKEQAGACDPQHDDGDNVAAGADAGVAGCA